jgi:hypothetical protein
MRLSRWPPIRLQGCVICFAGPDSYSMVDALDENFAVTDLGRACRPRDRVDNTFNEAGLDHDLNLDLWKKGRGIFGAAVVLGMPLLSPEPFDLGNCHAFDANLHQRGPHFLELKWLDDGDDTSHGIIARCRFGESGASGIIPRVETSPKCNLGEVANLLGGIMLYANSRGRAWACRGNIA